ncbi:MAG: DNA polymerase III subunit alpha [Muribaculaceae bacterium]|nr:DNA polymerase III subunit alpha [Muribaculaceae bacterium]
MIPFVHLHVHSQFSILDGQASVKGLVDKAIADGMKGMALTDHGNMFGIKEFHDYVNKINADTNKALKEAKKRMEEAEAAGDATAAEAAKSEIDGLKHHLFKPIFGCEMYVADNSMLDQSDKNDKGKHLIVLAKNEKGYHNLVKLVSQAWTEGYYYHPRTDKAAIAAHREGLIICSACLGGEVPKLILNGEIKEAEKRILWWKETFGDDYYLELQRHKATVERANHETFEKQQEVNAVLIEMAHKHGIKLICTNDVHFINEDDAEAHDRLICVSTNRFVSDESRMLYSKQEWFKTQEEMNGIFGDVPEALSNTLEILDKVETYSIDHDPILPNFPLPDGFTDNDEYLRYLTYEGAKKRWPELTDKLRERLDFELETIKNMGFPGYFLIVQDFIAAARRLGVSVGPGRGSAAGSAVAYCLGITQIDPIKYDLLFERFLNPDRISLPDIDIDFDDDGRADVLKYVTDKYGADKVAHIITYGTMAAKMAIKDVARVEQLPLAESNRLTKLIPAHMPEDPNKKGKELKPTLSNCYKYLPQFKDELESKEPLICSTLKYAQQLEGNVRNTGVHACGVIIGKDPITDRVPVSTATDKNGEKVLVTQFEGSVIEQTGLIKMDFLGLKTLSIIKEALANIKKSKGIDIDIDNIPIDDPKTYQLYCEGRTTGTFQFESAGMQTNLRSLHPQTFEDLIAMNALYRPGPMDYIPEFIDRKHGRKKIEYDIPIMEKYLKDTYGITVYQEQAMLLSRELAGFTRGESNNLRKAMGKKLIDKMNALKGKFIEGGIARGHSQETLEKIWNDWAKFAEYAFNKSHATCYSWVAFQTAYLKANYPAEYMAAVLSRNLDNTDKLTVFMDECRSMGINVLGPDINESFTRFGVNSHGDIRFGLAAIKGIGVTVINAIIKEREENGPFKDIYDVFERVPISSLNRRMVDALALSGAFDSFAPTVKREDFFEPNSRGETLSELLIRYGQQFQSHKRSQEMSLFGGFDDDMSTEARPAVTPARAWSDLERLDRERELVGMYLSAHPLDDYYFDITYGCNSSTQQMKSISSETTLKEGAVFTFAGIVTDYEVKQTSKGKNFGILKIEDFEGSYEVRLFDKNLIDYGKFGVKGTPVKVEMTYKRLYASSSPRLEVTHIVLLESGKSSFYIEIKIPIERVNNVIVDQLSPMFADEKQTASMPLTFQVWHPELERSIRLRSDKRLQLSRKLLQVLNANDLEFKITTSSN